jgi:hypothetical protein
VNGQPQPEPEDDTMTTTAADLMTSLDSKATGPDATERLWALATEAQEANEWALARRIFAAIRTAAR